VKEPRVEGERAGVLPVRGSLSLVLPAYNEAANIEAVVRRALTVLPPLVEDLEIIIVNDGSRDETGAIAERLAREDERVRVVHHEVNRGYGAALRSGFAASRGDLVMFMDADQQFDPADFVHLAPFCRMPTSWRATVCVAAIPGSAWSTQRFSMQPCVSSLASRCAISTVRSRCSAVISCERSISA